jgi:hypothetical protein
MGEESVVAEKEKKSMGNFRVEVTSSLEGVLVRCECVLSPFRHFSSLVKLH